MYRWLQTQLTEWLILTSLSVSFRITHVAFQRSVFPRQCFAPFLRPFTFTFSVQHYYRTLRNWTLLFCSAVCILLITEVFFPFFFFSIAVFFIPVVARRHRQSDIFFFRFSSASSLLPYFRLLQSSLYRRICFCHAAASFSLLFSRSSIMIVLFVSFCPLSRVSFFVLTFLTCLLFSHSCCLRITIIIILNRCDRIIYLLFRFYFLPSHSSPLPFCHVAFSFPFYLHLLRFDHYSIMPPFFCLVTTSPSSSILLLYLSQDHVNKLFLHVSRALICLSEVKKRSRLALLVFCSYQITSDRDVTPSLCWTRQWNC